MTSLSTFCFSFFFFFFFFNDTATTEIYTLSLHDALPTWNWTKSTGSCGAGGPRWSSRRRSSDRKSTRLNSSHMSISYAVFCLKKKKKKNKQIQIIKKKKQKKKK